MISKKFIITVSILIFSSIILPPAFGCGVEREGGYMTSPFKVGLMEKFDYDGDKAGYDETLDFWEGYVNGNISRKDIRHFFDNASLKSLKSGESYKFYDYLTSTNDKNAINYINYCLELNQLIDVYMGYLWDYETPDTEDIKEFIQKINKVSTSKEFKPRYEFLKIRAYGAIKDNDGVMKIWEKNKKMEPSPLRDRLEGYVGGVLYREGKYPEALEYFSKAGDRNSIEWCVEKLAGSDNLAKLYNYNPNSAAIPFILQDYMNYIIGTTNAGRLLSLPNVNKFYDINYDEVSVEDIKSQIKEMKNLCQKALAEEKSNNLKMWATALGVLQGIDGDTPEALATLQIAKNLPGDELSDNNLDNFTLWALMLNSGKGNDRIDAEFANNLEKKYNEIWKLIKINSRDYSKEGISKRNSENFDKSKSDAVFITEFMKEETPAHFISLNQPQRAMAFLTIIEELPSDDYSYSYYYDLQNSLDKLISLDQAKEFLKFIENGSPSNPIDKVMKKYADQYENLANDVIGTRLMREGKFKEALPYLSKVDRKWIGTQPVAAYLRGYTPTNADYYKFQRQNTHPAQAGRTNNYNYKANYCADVIAKIEAFENSSGDEKARNAVDLAALTHFASPLGDGWALSEYNWSSTEPVNEFTEMMRNWIREALKYSKSDKTKSLAYFALLSIPDTKKESDYTDSYYYLFPYDHTVKENNKVDRYYLDSPSNEQMTGLNWFKSYWDNSEDLYYVSSCDILKSYVAGRFINKPSYY